MPDQELLDDFLEALEQAGCVISTDTSQRATALEWVSSQWVGREP